MSQFILAHMTRNERLASLRLHARIAHMFTGDMQVRAFDAMHAIDTFAHEAGDTRTSRHVARYVKFFDAH